MALNFLIVDDSQTVRAVITKTLQMSGMDVGEIHHAANGREALDLLDEHWIDLIFSDIHMPVMSGIEMVNKLQEDGVLKTMPVIIVSTEGSQTRIEQLKAKGISAYIRKPFTPELIKSVVDDVLEKNHAN